MWRGMQKMESLVTDTLFHWTIVAFVITLVCHVLYIGIAFWRNLKAWKTLKPIWLATLVVFFGVWLVLALVFALAKHGRLAHSLEHPFPLAWKVVIFLPNLIVQVHISFSNSRTYANIYVADTGYHVSS